MGFQGYPNAQSTGVKGQGAVSVLTSTTQIVAANEGRVEVTIQNDHATQVVYLAFGQAAVANQGVRINGLGGQYTTSSYSGAINGISVGGTSVCTFVEV